MKILKAALIFFGITLVLLGCSCYDTSLNIEQHILFHFSYINQAWSYQHWGWFIDNTGEVKSYKVQSPANWNLADSNGYISSDRLEENYQLANICFYKISKSELKKYLLIDSAAKGNLSQETYQGADGGVNIFYCYYWDKEQEKYKQVLLSKSGDVNQNNLHPNAIVLDNWLKEINKLYKP